ncbi:coagulation factor IX-like isoform X1 [Daphnia pulicaria]|uniref:coagulation factor IX-like isoform X1 n=1 Tax=Daphnia pulicaria TaxID=35523 RepID=UPI001EEABE7C|nr:coagulation factor IX-like isoform X1 [Daphnia pulicaria]
MMQQPIACFLLVIIGFVAGAPGFNGRIIGGTPVTPDPDGIVTQFPYVVSIEDDFNHFCGGFIYNPKWVVTSASCMENKVISRLTVVAGQMNLIDPEKTEERQSVFKVIPYSTYNNVTRKDDIALIELSNAFTLDTQARDLIKFNEVFTDEGYTPTGTFIGWGATVLGGGFSPRLRYADVKMVENNPVCNPYNSEEFTISSMICAATIPETLPSGPAEPTPCALDDGSPLVQTYNGANAETTIVVGVLSKYSPICDSADSSVFTRLSVYYAWLYRTAGEQVYTTP